MHDVDRTTLEYGSELYEYGESPLYSEQGEYSAEQGTVLGEILGEAQGSYEGPFESGYGELPLPEMMEDELAAELLEVRSDQELDHFLGSLISKAVSTVKKAIASPLGQQLTGVLRQIGKKVLPIAGGAFGLEWEGLSPEDRDFEIARRYVRFAGHAARRAAMAPPQADPQRVIKDAVVDAAKKFAPGLLAPAAGIGGAPGYRPPAPPPIYAGPQTNIYAAPEPSPAAGQPEPSCPSCGGTAGCRRHHGKWVRRGRHIILLGV